MQEIITQFVEQFTDGRITRRDLVGRLAGLMAAAAGAGAVTSALAQSTRPATAPTFTATGVDHLALSVTDVARSRDFYARHLGLPVLRQRGDRQCFMGAGEDFVALFKGATPGLHHYSYAVSAAQKAEAVERLTAAGLKPRQEENRVYFSDPDGLTVQVSGPGTRPVSA